MALHPPGWRSGGCVAGRGAHCAPPQIYEGVSSLLDKLGVWYHLANGTSDLKEMAQTGLRILVGYIMLQDPQVGHPFLGLWMRPQPLGQGWWPHLMSHVPPQLHSLAYVKLHSLLQTASAPKKDEACYLLGKLETPLRRSLDAKSETFSWLVPIVRTLMDQCYETLQLQLFLPSLPPTNGSPTFYEDFQLFCTTPEWRGFIEKHVGAVGRGVASVVGNTFPGLEMGLYCGGVPPPGWDSLQG